MEKKEEKVLKKSFFKKIWYSLDKIDKYPELATEGFWSAVKYLMILTIILAVISSLSSVFNITKAVNKLAQYIDENSPELLYSEGVLDVKTEEPIIEENDELGKVIIDTKTDDEEQINKYIEQINDDENAVIILKDKIILKEEGLSNQVTYKYEELFSQMNITSFNKSDLVNYLTGSKMATMYLNLTLVLVIYTFVILLINTLTNIIGVAIVGYFASLILKLKLRFVAVFNMAIYSITLPTILYILYMIINAFYPFVITYFALMYIVIASIYMTAAIFMIKTDFDKKQGEVQKIVEVEKQVKEEMKEKENKEEKDKEDKEDNKEENKDNKEEKKDNEEGKDGEQPEGSNA